MADSISLPREVDLSLSRKHKNAIYQYAARVVVGGQYRLAIFKWLRNVPEVVAGSIEHLALTKLKTEFPTVW